MMNTNAFKNHRSGDGLLSVLFCSSPLSCPPPPDQGGAWSSSGFLPVKGSFSCHSWGVKLWVSVSSRDSVELVGLHF